MDKFLVWMGHRKNLTLDKGYHSSYKYQNHLEREYKGDE